MEKVNGIFDLYVPDKKSPALFGRTFAVVDCDKFVPPLRVSVKTIGFDGVPDDVSAPAGSVAETSTDQESESAIAAVAEPASPTAYWNSRGGESAPGERSRIVKTTVSSAS